MPAPALSSAIWAAGPAPFAVTNPANLINLAFTILPLVMVIARAGGACCGTGASCPSSCGAMARGAEKDRGTGRRGRPVGAASTVFLGNIEGQLVIRPYLARLTRTELFILMTVGLSVIAGTVFVLYATILKDVLPGALGHLLVASLMSLPAGILIARIMVPGPAETELTQEQESVRYRSTMDAMARGTEDGLNIYLQIIAMLIVTTALVALANVILAHAAAVCGRAADPGADAGLAVRAAGLAAGRALAPGRDGRRPDGHQVGPQ